MDLVPDKLNHNFWVCGKNEVEIRALMANAEQYYARVDAFSKNGIIEVKTCMV